MNRLETRIPPPLVALLAVALMWACNRWVATWLGSASPWLLVVAFVVFITRFQIIPEERALAKKFGVTYSTYQTKVARWIGLPR